jgi:hypothetical protein
MPDHQPPRLPEREADAVAAGRVTYTARFVPPAAECSQMRTESARRLAEAGRPNVPDRSAGNGETIGRRRAARIIARLGEIYMQAMADPEPEAGA